MRMTRWISLSVAALIFLGLGACATGGGTQVLRSTQLTAADLEPYRDLTVYEFLRRHSRVSFFDRQTAGEVMYTFSYGGAGSLTQGGIQPAALRVNDHEVLSPVEELRTMSMREVVRLEILRPTEYSSRYGGEGRRGAVLITLRGEDSG